MTSVLARDTAAEPAAELPPARLLALQRLGLLDTLPEEAFDRLTRLAARVLHAPVALVSLVDAERQFFKSSVGLPEPWASRRETPLSHSFCRHVVASGAVLVIADARQHPLVGDNPAIADLGVVAYAGVPLVTADGDTLGSFCVIDTEPRAWTEEEVAILTELAGAVMAQIELPVVAREALRQAAQAERERQALAASERRYRSVVEAAGDAIVVADSRGMIVSWNGAAERMFGYREIEVVATPLTRLMPARFRSPHETGLQRVAATGTSPRAGHTVELLGLRKDGGEFPIELSLATWESAQGRCFSGIIRDISARVQADATMRESEERYRQTFAGSQAVTLLIDPDAGAIVDVNQAACDFYGYRRDALTTMTIAAINTLPPAALAAELARIASGDAACLRVQHRLASGALRDVEVYSSAVDVRGKRLLYSIIHDVTERVRVEQQLAHQAFHDALTGLPNRALFHDRLTHALEQAERKHERLAVLFVDLDGFKGVNDTLGHGVGDDLLVAVGRRLARCVRTGDTVARFGGDEFTLLLGGLVGGPDGEHEAWRRATRVLAALQRPFTLRGCRQFITASVGLTLSMPGGEPGQPQRLLREADLALRQAKGAGKARVTVFAPAMSALALARRELETDLRRAVERGELVLHYQPVIALDRGVMTGVEALVRLQHPRRGLIAPGAFIPLAEETGLILPVGQWVLAEACRQARVWQERPPAGAPLVVSVNLSAHQLHRPDLVASVAAVLAQTGLDPAGLELEITESVVMEDAPATIATLQALKGLGVRLAIDDFGTGYSSLSYLRRFPIDTLKVDQSFVGELGQGTGATAIVRAVTELAHVLGMTVTVEGVETAQQLELVRSLGCDRVQGFYYARPVAADVLSTQARP